MKDQAEKYRYQVLHFPGRWMDDPARQALAAELRATAATCFEQLPDYQCLRGTREELSDKVIAVGRRADGTMAGFCSTVLLDVPDVGPVLHLGLTCVRPDARGGGLTHKLNGRAVIGYLLRRRPLGRLWITNCACVLSSLGNVALNFDDVYPSPFFRGRPTEAQRRIAAELDRRCRDKLYVRPEAVLDGEAFVFRGSVRSTVFQKSAEQKAFHHRMGDLNAFYRELLDFEQGDEVLQVGSVNLLTTGPKYWLRRTTLRRRAGRGLGPLQHEPAG
jgi:hypothetical protein